MVAVMGIPADYLPILQNLKFSKGTPISWIAAVCERTGWNPNYEKLNPNNLNEWWNRVRQFGISGLWNSIPEVNLHPGEGGAGCTAAGWGAWNNSVLWPAHCCSLWVDSNKRDPAYGLDKAADVLNECASTIRGVCGELNAHMFMRWQLGCWYVPVIDAQGHCQPIPNIPDIFPNEANTIAQIQQVYAEMLDEDYVVPPPALTLCNAALTPLALRRWLVDHGYTGPTDLNSMIAAYNKKACPAAPPGSGGTPPPGGGGTVGATGGSIWPVIAGAVLIGGTLLAANERAKRIGLH